MNWNSWSEFWAMGGHGLFIWGSFGLALLLMALETAHVATRGRRALQEPVDDPQAHDATGSTGDPA